MSKLLIDEHPLLVLPSLAKAIGLPESIFLQQVHYWIEANGHLQDDGRRWIFNSYDAWSRQFPWWNIGTIRRIVATLRDAGLIETSTRFNRLGIDHTLWYTIDYIRLEQLTAPPSDPEPPEPSDPEPPEPSDPEPPKPPVKNDTSSAENDRRSAQNAQTIRAECADDPREMRATITRELLSETSPETPEDGGGGGSDHPLDPALPDSEKNARPPAREAAAPPPPESPTYDDANRNPAALDAALLYAEILDAPTRLSILAANPALTVEAIFAWDTYRARTNATNGRKLGPGALVSLLRTAAAPPRSTLNPTHTETWLIANGYLSYPEPDPSTPAATNQPASPTQPQSAPFPNPPPPDPAAHALWQPVISELSMTHRAAYDNWLRHAIPTHYDPDTGAFVVIAHNPYAQDWISQRMNGMLTQRLQTLAGRPITLTILPHPAPP